MLILTRDLFESINIGDDVRITVLGVKGNQVRIGISAPSSLPVHREEIYEKIQREAQAMTRQPQGPAETVKRRVEVDARAMTKQEQQPQGPAVTIKRRAAAGR